MTLIKKLALGMLFMLFVVFIGTYIITMNNARNFFITQTENNAQDTATSLGMSLAPPLKGHDINKINTMAQAVLNKGDVALIQVKDANGDVIVIRKQSVQPTTIPKWFINLIQLPLTNKTSNIMNGTASAGSVSVISDPQTVYFSLWRNAVEMVKAYLIFALVALILVYSLIQFLLKPLKKVTAQALAISEHEFPIETEIPKTSELKQVTLAMNHMVLKIKSFFQEQLHQTESLRLQVYQDPLTGLSNRRYFSQQISSILDSEDEFVPGFVLLLVVDGLDELNQQHGHKQGDNLILTIARTCKSFWNQPSVSTLARINGSSFALINYELDPEVFDEQCQKFEKILRKAINDVPLCDVHMGAVNYYAHQTMSNLLTLVDQSVKKARETGVFYIQKEHEDFKFPKQVTIEDIEYALQEKTIGLFTQPITDGEQTLHKELFVRMRDVHGEELSAGYFMPIAELLGVAYQIDLHVLKELAAKPIALEESFAINVSADTLMNSEHTEVYLHHLKALPKSVVNNLAIEINESLVLSHFDEVKYFTKHAKKLGVAIGVDRVGVHFSPLHYLSDLNIDYIKLHGSLVQDIHENESKQFFIHYFNEMAKTLDIQVVATQIEEESQWRSLQLIRIVWGQGRFLGGIEHLD